MAVDWMTPDELAKLTGKTTKRLAQYRADLEGIPYHKIPGTSIILYDRDEFDAIVKANRVETRNHRKGLGSD